jgi:hypothetical protein
MWCVYEYDTMASNRGFLPLYIIPVPLDVTYGHVVRPSMINFRVNYCNLYMLLVILLEVQK